MNYRENFCKYDIKQFVKDICKEFEIDYWDEWLENQDYDVLKNPPNY